MTPHDLATLERGPDGGDGFLGAPPMLLGPEAHAWHVYWTLRPSTPADEPVNLLDALTLHERLFGEPDADYLFTCIRVMDGEYARDRSERLERERKKA